MSMGWGWNARGLLSFDPHVREFVVFLTVLGLFILGGGASTGWGERRFVILILTNPDSSSGWTSSDV